MQGVFPESRDLTGVMARIMPLHTELNWRLDSCRFVILQLIGYSPITLSVVGQLIIQVNKERT